MSTFGSFDKRVASPAVAGNATSQALGSETPFKDSQRPLIDTIATRAEVQLVSCAGECLSRLFPGGKSLSSVALYITVTVLLL
jgi:hypothetical protein